MLLSVFCVHFHPSRLRKTFSYCRRCCVKCCRQQHTRIKKKKGKLKPNVCKLVSLEFSRLLFVLLFAYTKLFSPRWSFPIFSSSLFDPHIYPSTIFFLVERINGGKKNESFVMEIVNLQLRNECCLKILQSFDELSLSVNWENREKFPSSWNSFDGSLRSGQIDVVIVWYVIFMEFELEYETSGTIDGCLAISMFNRYPRRSREMLNSNGEVDSWERERERDSSICERRICVLLWCWLLK